MKQLGRALIAALLVIGFGCGGSDGSADAGRDSQTGQPDGATDSGPVSLCGASSDCDDGVYCNGFETCAPGEDGAGADGCVPGADPCSAGELCDEARSACVPDDCANPDADDDGHARIGCGDGDDCDDDDPNRFPGNPEVCDPEGHDEDCDPNTISGNPDMDGDGHIDVMCFNVREDGTENRGTDCDDTSNTVNPDAAESCNGIDDDCDGMIDEGVLETFYRDVDGDGYGCIPDTEGCPHPVSACVKPDGYVSNSGDCDDRPGLGAAIHPAAAEFCDGVDNDCNGIIDDPSEGCECATEPPRSCGPAEAGVGRCVAGTQACVNGRWTTHCEGAVYPAPTETCDAGDEDCDGLTNDNDPDIAGGDPAVTGATVYYRDADGDGFGCKVGMAGCPAPVSACIKPEGYVSISGDCDDSPVLGAAIHPAAAETCDGQDNDCDGSVDEDVATACYPDGDGDGYSPGGHPLFHCGSCPPGHTARAPADGVDCDDSDSSVYPGALEICGGIDEDCDGLMDEAAADLGTRDHCGACGDVCQFFCDTSGWPTCDLPTRIDSWMYTTCVSTEHGRYFCWGAGDAGQLAPGAATPADSSRPAQIPLQFAGTRSPYLSVGRYHVCASGSDTMCWGGNSSGQVGVGSLVSQFVPSVVAGVRLTGVRLSAGEELSCAVTGIPPSGSGSLYCWGGQVPIRDASGIWNLERRMEPTRVGFLNDHVEVSVGASSCYRDSAGDVWCWGQNSTGEIGAGFWGGAVAEPTRALLPGPASLVAVGLGYACALVNGTVYCWGEDHRGRLGDGPGSAETCGSLPCSTEPRPVALPSVSNLFVGRHVTCARLVSGETYCWGDSVSESVPGYTGALETPTRVPELDRFRVVRFGNFHGCGIDETSDEVWCWGQNTAGSTGNGSMSGSSGLMPVLPPL